VLDRRKRNDRAAKSRHLAQLKQEERWQNATNEARAELERRCAELVRLRRSGPQAA
jgi:hypothetical protein